LEEIGSTAEDAQRVTSDGTGRLGGEREIESETIVLDRDFFGENVLARVDSGDYHSTIG